MLLVSRQPQSFVQSGINSCYNGRSSPRALLRLCHLNMISRSQIIHCLMHSNIDRWKKTRNSEEVAEYSVPPPTVACGNKCFQKQPSAQLYIHPALFLETVKPCKADSIIACSLAANFFVACSLEKTGSHVHRERLRTRLVIKL